MDADDILIGKNNGKPDSDMKFLVDKGALFYDFTCKI